jgi:D-alanyl-D-alanine dipeptidase
MFVSSGANWVHCENSLAADRLRAHLMSCAGTRTPEALSVPPGLVDIRQAAPGLVVLDAPPWSHPELRFRVRPELAERLHRAAEMLPSDLRIGYWEGLRPLAVQRSLWERGIAYLRGLNPDAGGADLELELERYVARPEGGVPPHSTGGAVDLAPVDPFGRVLTPEDA